MTWRVLLGNCSPAFLFLSLILPAAYAEPHPVTPLAVQGIGNATVPLDGAWQFHLGDDQAWAAPGLDDATGHAGWEQIGVDKPWGAQGHFNYTGYAWYRRHVDFVPTPGATPDIALLMPPVQDVYEVYWNGTRVAGFGKFPPWPSWRYDALTQTVGLGKPRDGVLAIRVWQAPYVSFGTGDVGGLYTTPLVGNVDTIAALKTRSDYRWLEARQFTFGLDTLYGLVALLGLLGWWRNRSQRAIFWMSLFAGSHVLATVIDGLRLPMSFELALGILQPVLALQDVALWFLLLYLLELENHRFLPRLTKVLAWIAIASGSLDGLLSAFDPSASTHRFVQGADFVFTVITTLIQTFPLLLIPFAFRKRLGAARWLVAGFAFLAQLIFELRVAAAQGERFTHWTLARTIGQPVFTLNHNPFSVNTMASTCLLVAIVYAVYRYAVEQSERQGALEQEYKSAQELQRVLIPETLPSLRGYAVTSAYQPAQQVGGDFFQLIAREDGCALLVLGDVSGKGLKAAMTVSLIVGTLRTLAEQSDDPAAILAGLNRRLHGRLRNGFVTCLVLRLDSSGECVIANAGHPAPFLNQQEIASPGALPLGLELASRYETTKVELAVGDRLTLYTDGLLEARNTRGELYGFERLRALMSTRPDATGAMKAAIQFGQDDDITVLTITRLAVGAESTTSLLAPELVVAGL